MASEPGQLSQQLMSGVYRAVARRSLPSACRHIAEIGDHLPFVVEHPLIERKRGYGTKRCSPASSTRVAPPSPARKHRDVGSETHSVSVARIEVRHIAAESA